MTLRIERTETLRVVASDPEAAAMTPLHEAVAVVLDAAVAGDPQARAMIDALDDWREPETRALYPTESLIEAGGTLKEMREQYGWTNEQLTDAGMAVWLEPDSDRARELLVLQAEAATRWVVGRTAGTWAHVPPIDTDGESLLQLSIECEQLRDSRGKWIATAIVCAVIAGISIAVALVAPLL